MPFSPCPSGGEPSEVQSGVGLAVLSNDGQTAPGWVISASSLCVMAQTGDDEIQFSTKSLHFFWEVGAILGKMPDIIRNGTQPLA